MATNDKKAGGGDPTERITKMINDAVESALGNRDRKDQEAKDPWARIEGIVDRAVAKHFAEFARGIEDAGGEGDTETGRKPKAKGSDDPLSLFG